MKRPNAKKPPTCKSNDKTDWQLDSSFFPSFAVLIALFAYLGLWLLLPFVPLFWIRKCWFAGRPSRRLVYPSFNLVLVKAIEKIERQDTKRTKIVQDGGEVVKGVIYVKAVSRYQVTKTVRQGVGKKSKQITLGSAWKTVDDANKAARTARDWCVKYEHTITEDNYKEKIKELKKVTKNK